MLKIHVIILSTVFLGVASMANAFVVEDCNAEKCGDTSPESKKGLIKFCTALKGDDATKALDCGVAYYKLHQCNDDSADKKCDNAKNMIAEGFVNLENVNKTVFDSAVSASG